jgi:hypothetical protein
MTAWSDMRETVCLAGMVAVDPRPPLFVGDRAVFGCLEAIGYVKLGAVFAVSAGDQAVEV